MATNTKQQPSEKRNMTKLQLEEREAMCGDRGATIRVISALRKYRAAARKLLSERYRDGECDAVALGTFASEIEDIEEEE